MPFTLELPPGLRRARWKVKIREDERLEPPHVTILRGVRAWRVDLRTGRLMDPGAAWSQIDSGVQRAIRDNWDTLRDQWDRMYPTNPVGEGMDDD